MDKFTNKNNICSPHINKKSKTCFSRKSLFKIGKSLNIVKKNNIKMKTDTLWNLIRIKLANKCNNNETCWLDNISTIKKLNDAEIHLFTFKPKMPEEWKNNQYEWLDNTNIYKVMIQAEKVYKDFVFFGPVPSDCPTSIKCELSGLNFKELKKKRIHKLGIIFNFDVSTGPGTHWVGLYIDILNGEIDYFDSYGGRPIKLINNFIQEIATKMSKIGIEPKIIYNDKRHQYGHSECGMYSMYFILKRLTGSTMHELSKNKITDKKMNDLRKILYRE